MRKPRRDPTRAVEVLRECTNSIKGMALLMSNTSESKCADILWLLENKDVYAMEDAFSARDLETAVIYLRSCAAVQMSVADKLAELRGSLLANAPINLVTLEAAE